MNRRLAAEPTTLAAPAPHFPHTEFLQGQITAACPCGWRTIASSHEHSVRLGDEHRAEAVAAARQAARDALIDSAGGAL